MTKFIRKISVFFIVVAVIDMLCGFSLQYMHDHTSGGGTKSRYYVCKESNDDVLVFGSSRAKHHYVPTIIEDSLNVSCYNTGEEGNGIILCYGFLKMIIERYSPKLIIYDVSDYDIYQDDNMKYLGMLKPFYYENGEDSIFWRVNPMTRLMMLSNMYRYNTTCVSVLGNYLHPLSMYPKGYMASYGVMDYEPSEEKEEDRKQDSLKLYFFEEFIKLAKVHDIQIIAVVSPYYNATSKNVQYETIEKLCDTYNVPFFYLAADPDIAYNRKLFQDRTHMNDEGARCYTKHLIHYLRGVI